MESARNGRIGRGWPTRKHGGELAARADAQLGEDLPQVVGDGSGTEEQLRGDLRLNFAETVRDPASFWTPQAYIRLRRIKAAVDPQDRIRSNHPIPPAGRP